MAVLDGLRSGKCTTHHVELDASYINWTIVAIARMTLLGALVVTFAALWSCIIITIIIMSSKFQSSGSCNVWNSAPTLTFNKKISDLLKKKI